LWLAIPPAALADQPKQPLHDASKLAGTWLFDAAVVNRDNRQLGPFWGGTVVVAGDSFTAPKFMGQSKDLKAKFTLDPAAAPAAIDLKPEELILTDADDPVKMTVPAGTVAGICKLDGDRLTVCFNMEIGGKRPMSFDDAGEKLVRMTLVRAPAGFKAFPAEVTVTVAGPDGKPAAGATVGHWLARREDRENKAAPGEWNLATPTRVAADGTGRVKFAEAEKVIARDPQGHSMAIATPSPASLLSGPVRLRLQHECRVSARVVCETMKKAGQPIGWVDSYVMKGGIRFAFCNSLEGKLEFVLPPGDYTLHAYGTNFHRRYVNITVPAGKDEFTVDPIALTASQLVLLRGKPAPELAGVVGWKGPPVKLADLKGKLVLLEFTGYWCGPCMGFMPTLIELHEKYADRGLAIVAVHVDTDGEVATAAQLDEKLAQPRKSLWNGKDVPFSMALTSGKTVGEGDLKSRGQAAAQYGVMKYPTTILIGRDGKMVGEFHARDVKLASEQIEKLLNAKN
jgi:uncharacterized protein (TIGR03067 family)